MGMIEVENNSTQGPQNLGFDVTGEDGIIFFRVTNEDDDGQEILSFTTDAMTDADTLIADLKQAIEDAF